MADQVPFSTPVFADPKLVENPDSRCPVVLLADTSGSMDGAPLAALNAGLVAFKDSLMADALAPKRVEIALITFGPVRVHNEFTTADLWTPPVLSANGNTPMGEAIERGIDLLDQRKAQYHAADNKYYRPWVFLFTDGEPTDAWEAAAKRVHDGEANRKFMFFAVAVGEAKMDTLSQIAPPSRRPLPMKGLAFREMFLWLSASLKSVSASRPGEKAVISNPTAGPEGWASTT
jgi:uncharacterized protein YegL